MPHRLGTPVWMLRSEEVGFVLLWLNRLWVLGVQASLVDAGSFTEGVGGSWVMESQGCRASLLFGWSPLWPGDLLLF